MKKIYFALFIISAFTTFASAAFLFLPIEERVRESNLIVIGTLHDVSKSETDDFRISKGTLVIEQIIFGKFQNSNGQSLKPGEKVRVEWANSKTFACQFGFPENKKEIWFLTVDDKGEIKSLSPSTTAALSELAEVKKHLRKKEKNNAVKLLNTIIGEREKAAQLNSSEETSQKETIRYSLSAKTEQKEYSLLSAFFVALTSVALYFLLYRSRFRIR